MRRPPLFIFFAIAVVGMVTISVAAAMASPDFAFFLQTGHFPVYKIEVLRALVRINGWSADGLITADGKTLPLPGLRSLPIQSPALVEVTKRGVEIGPNGRIYGLVNIHHWCGNDSVRREIARVDVADMLMYLRLGEPLSPVAEADALAPKVGGEFDDYGWSVSEFGQFRGWQILKNYDK